MLGALALFSFVWAGVRVSEIKRSSFSTSATSQLATEPLGDRFGFAKGIIEE